MKRRRWREAVRRVRGFFSEHREGMRSLLLVVLAIGVAAQSSMLWSRVLTLDSMPWSGARAFLSASTKQDKQVDNRAGAMPVRFAARSESELYGIQYNETGLETAYQNTAEVWVQAVEQAEKPTISGSGEYSDALQGQMMLMQYDGRIPLEIIAGWLGCDLPEDLNGYVAGTLALCRSDEGGYTLYVRDSSDDSIVCAQTQVDDARFDTAVEQFEPNDCELAADLEGELVSPDLLYFPGGETFDVMSFQAYSGGSGMAELLTAFGMDANTALDNAYATDGVMVYVSGSSTVHMAEDGSMRYDGKIHLPVKAGNRKMQCVQMAFELTSEALEAIDCGAAAALTTAYTEQDTGRFIVVYGMQVNGVPVDNGVTGYFARYEFDGETLVHANLALRTCESSGETVAVMPEKQAVASLDSAVDASLSLRYVDEAVGTSSSWEQLYQEDVMSSDNLWDVENEEYAEEDGWNDTPAGDDTEDDYSTPWYDNTGTPVAPQWYVLRYGDEDELPKFGRTLTPDEIVYIRPDFNRLIQGGSAS